MAGGATDTRTLLERIESQPIPYERANSIYRALGDSTAGGSSVRSTQLNPTDRPVNARAAFYESSDYFEQLLKRPWSPRVVPPGPQVLLPLPEGPLSDLINQPAPPKVPPVETPPPSRGPTPADLPSGGGGGGSYVDRPSLFSQLVRSPVARRAVSVLNAVGPIAEAYGFWDTYLNAPPEFTIADFIKRERGPQERRGPRTRTAPLPTTSLGDDPTFSGQLLDQRRGGPEPVSPGTSPRYLVDTDPLGLLQFLLEPLSRVAGGLRDTVTTALRATRPSSLVQPSPSPRTRVREQPSTRASGPDVAQPIDASSPSSSPLPLSSGSPQPPDCETIVRDKRRAKRKACKVIGYETVTIKRRVCAKG